MTRFYKTMRELDQLVGTIKDYKRVGNMKKARELTSEGRAELRVRPRLIKIRSQLSKINASIRKVYNSNRSPDEKRKQLDILTQKRNNKTKQAYDILMKSRGKIISRTAPITTERAMTLREAMRLK